MKCLLIHESANELAKLTKELKLIPFLEQLDQSHSVFDAFECMQNKNYDLIFISTCLNTISGVEFVRSLNQKPLVIFLSNTDKYALDAFNLGAVDYILDDINLARLLRACNRALEFHEVRTQKTKSKQVKTSVGEQDFLLVKANAGYRKIFTHDILYIESLKDYVRIHTKDHKIISLNSLKAICKRLHEQEFTRIHKSYIVSLDKIKLISKKHVEIENVQIPIGERYKSDFHNILNNASQYISA